MGLCKEGVFSHGSWLRGRDWSESGQKGTSLASYILLLSLFSELEKHKYLNRILDKEEYFLIEEKILINLSSW